VDIEKLTVSYDAASDELASVKAELKEANKTASDAGKQVANLEGHLAVYKVVGCI